ncbi:hypothetical protein TSAR_003555 [Trichomalopsis sarcophagae]|uniref:Uncharacterized protein n=1 Tax=Trichomalopsis sarcophagae TaxID=543379 RepID=A0A232F100_9HYME|nr:hypothetical protein TSAR_003555 [Trichomalopsis sarcophagae]
MLSTQAVTFNVINAAFLGAPCGQCRELCPNGYVPHFWRNEKVPPIMSPTMNSESLGGDERANYNAFLHPDCQSPQAGWKKKYSALILLAYALLDDSSFPEDIETSTSPCSSLVQLDYQTRSYLCYLILLPVDLVETSTYPCSSLVQLDCQT